MNMGSRQRAGNSTTPSWCFRYRGIDFSNPEQDLVDSISNTSAHEATHLWIGGVYSNTRNEEEPWMTEGGTEYLADRARNSAEQIRAEFEQRLNKCLSNIEDRPLDASKGGCVWRTAL